MTTQRLLDLVRTSFLSVKVNNWILAKEQIVRNLNDIILYDYEKKSYINDSKLKITITESIYLLEQFFRKITYNKYEPKEKSNITLYDLDQFIKKCIELILSKQKDKLDPFDYFN